MTKENNSKSKVDKTETAKDPKSTEFKTAEDSTVKLLAYCQLEKIAQNIVAKLKVPKNTTTLVLSTDSNLFSSLQAYNATIHLIELLDRSCSEILSQVSHLSEKVLRAEQKDEEIKGVSAAGKALPLTGTLKAVTETLKAVSGVFGLFKTEQTIKQVGMDLDKDAVIAAVAGELSEKHSDFKLRYENGMRGGKGTLVEKLSNLRARREELNTYVTALGEDNSEAKVLLNMVDEFIKGLAKDGEEKLVALLKAESLDNQLDDGIYLLLLKSLFAGGDRIETKRLFFSDVKISVSGGAAVSFMLFNRNAEILSSGNVQSFSGYQPYLEIKT